MRIQIKGILVLSAALITTVIAAPNNGVLKDSRDGKQYKTAKIGNQTWMAENLNYDAPESSCYEDFLDKETKPEENCEKYGRLYSWATAVEKSDSTCGSLKNLSKKDCSLPKGKVQGVCPKGWHIPTGEEAFTLIQTVGENSAKKLKSTTGWKGLIIGKTAKPGNYNYGKNGEDLYGFSAIPVGYKNTAEGSSLELWTTTISHGWLVTLSIVGDNDEARVVEGAAPSSRFSVRCVKD